MAFFGQTVAASVMTYHMMSMKGMNQQAQVQDMSQMDHSHHAMVDNTDLDNAEKTSKSCCTKSCDCFTGSCSNSAALIKVVSHIFIVDDFSSRITSVSNLALSQRLTSLYKPPILS